MSAATLSTQASPHAEAPMNSAVMRQVQVKEPNIA